MPPRADDQENAIPAAAPVAGGSRLEQLPAELIQPIFDFLYIFDEYHQPHLIRPLSKHLLPFSTAALYRRIKIKDGVDLAELCSSLSSPATASLVIELELDGNRVEEDDLGQYANAFERNIGNVLLSLKNLKHLEVSNWNMVGKTVLSSRFGREGGRALESIKLASCFRSIVGSIITALGHLGHLPRLSHLDYQNTSLTFIKEDDNPPNSGGFKQLKTLKCGLNNFSSSHASLLASLFSMLKLESVQLFSFHLTTRPNFAILDSLLATIEKLELHAPIIGRFTDSIQPPLSLERFHKLQKLSFLDFRIFDEELVDQLIDLGAHALGSLLIDQRCQITFQLLHRLLSGLGKDSKFKQIDLASLMSAGTIGLSYKNGALPVLKNDILVPGAGWKRPEWTSITYLEAQELERMSIEKGVELIGPMKEALGVERKFEEEEKRLENTMKYMRTGRIGGLYLF